MREIPLTRGYVALVDDADYDLVSQLKWTAMPVLDGRLVYAYRKVAERPVYLHRFLLSLTDPKIEVDHKDHNGLNCQRYNMRLATHTENQHNQRKQSNNTSGFIGVSWDRRERKWRAQIFLGRRKVCLGGYHSKELSAAIYNAAAMIYHGKFACYNDVV